MGPEGEGGGKEVRDQRRARGGRGRGQRREEKDTKIVKVELFSLSLCYGQEHSTQHSL